MVQTVMRLGHEGDPTASKAMRQPWGVGFAIKAKGMELRAGWLFILQVLLFWLSFGSNWFLLYMCRVQSWNSVFHE